MTSPLTVSGLRVIHAGDLHFPQRLQFDLDCAKYLVAEYRGPRHAF